MEIIQLTLPAKRTFVTCAPVITSSCVAQNEATEEHVALALRPGGRCLCELRYSAPAQVITTARKGQAKDDSLLALVRTSIDVGADQGEGYPSVLPRRGIASRRAP